MQIEYKSPAEKDAANIMAGVKILQEIDSTITFCALDKVLLCGHGLRLNARVEEMKALGWEWNKQEYSWSYYIGHG